MITSINGISVGEVIPSNVTKTPYIVRHIEYDGSILIAPVHAVSRRERIWCDHLLNWKKQAEQRASAQALLVD